jgi:hypothetical protein
MAYEGEEGFRWWNASAHADGGLASRQGGGAASSAQGLLFEDPAEDVTQLTVSGGGAIITSVAASDWRWGQCADTASTGKKIFEIELTTHVTYVAIGCCPTANGRSTGFAGEDNGSAILVYSGAMLHYDGPGAEDYTAIASGFDNPASGDVYTCAIDLDNELVSWLQNGNLVIDEVAYDAGAAQGDPYSPFIKTFDTGVVWTIPDEVANGVSGYSPF